MPDMFRPNGVTKFFKDVEVGLKAGFFRTFNEVAEHCEAIKNGGAAAPSPVADTTPPAPPAALVDPNAPKPPADDSGSEDAAKRHLSPDMIEAATVEELKAWASELGIEPEQHHMTLRKVIRETLDAEVGAG